jgi:protein involved in polysaccharide export with SLBB domain
LAGCADARFLRHACAEPPTPAEADAPPDPGYRVGCPDVLAVSFADRPDLDAAAAIDLDGRLPLPDLGRPAVAGESLEHVRGELARLAGVPPDRVGVSLAAPRSGRVYVHGPVRGRVRVVPYRGPEPVMDFLRRVGGLPPGSKLSAVYVVRPNVAAGGRPEVFRVDVAAVVLDGDGATNVPVRPSDQVYVGETRGSVVARFLPHWLGAAYRRLVGLLPDVLPSRGSRPWQQAAVPPGLPDSEPRSGGGR